MRQLLRQGAEGSVVWVQCVLGARAVLDIANVNVIGAKSGPAAWSTAARCCANPGTKQGRRKAAEGRSAQLPGKVVT